jgi:hypothetical protein
LACVFVCAGSSTSLLRKEWAAAIAIIVLGSVIAPAGSSDGLPALASAALFFSLAVFVLIRFGLLAVVANYVIHSLLADFPLTTQMSSWYSGISLAVILLMAAIAFYGFHTSLGGRPAFSGVAFED